MIRCYGMDINVEKTNVMKISRHSPQYTLGKQLEDVEYFNCLGNMVTNNERHTREIKSRIAIAKAAFNKTKILLARKMVLNLRKKLVKGYICSVAFCGAELGHFGK